MQGRILKFGLGLVAVVSLVVPTAIGQDPPAKTPPAGEGQMSAPQKVTINGKVSAVTDTTLTVVDDQKAEQVIAIDAKTKITKAGKAAKIADIKAEDVVIVEASKGEGNALTAIAIKVS